MTLKQQRLEEDKIELLRDAGERDNQVRNGEMNNVCNPAITAECAQIGSVRPATQVEKLQWSLLSRESEAELLRSQLHAVSQEKLDQVQEVTDLQRKLQVAQSKVSLPQEIILISSMEK